MLHRAILAAGVCWAAVSATAIGREWTDATGKYSVEADLIGFDDEMAVLKRQDHALVSVPIAKLSQADRDYLNSGHAHETVHRSADQMQTWTMPSGLKVIGKIVDYGRKEVTVQRRRGKIYVNDRHFENLPEVYQVMLPKIVAHFEGIDVAGKTGLQSWAVKQKGQPRTFPLEGVVLELENGDEYGVPFFFFSEEDLKVLQPGWERWLHASHADDSARKRQQESLFLQSAAQAYHQDRLANQQMAMMQLDLLAAASGVVDMWEVCLYPGPGVRSMPLAVVVPARDSRSAAQAALARNPGFVVGPVSMVSGRGRRR